MLRILARFLGERLHELVHGGAQIIHQFFKLFVAGAALQRLAQRILCLPQRLFGLRDIAVLDLQGHRPHARDHVAQRVVAFGVAQIEKQRTQAEIDAEFRREAFRREGQHVERGQHQRLVVGVERQDAALLDQSARDRLDEDALRQEHIGRFAAAFIAGLVARDQGEHDLGAGQRMLGQILSGLRDAGARTRLRQGQRKIRRGVKRAALFSTSLAGFLVFLRPILEREGRPRFDDAIVVIHTIIEPQRAARLPLRLLDQRNVRRAVGNGAEGPDRIVAADAA